METDNRYEELRVAAIEFVAIFDECYLDEGDRLWLTQIIRRCPKEASRAECLRRLLTALENDLRAGREIKQFNEFARVLYGMEEVQKQAIEIGLARLAAMACEVAGIPTTTIQEVVDACIVEGCGQYAHYLVSGGEADWWTGSSSESPARETLAGIDRAGKLVEQLSTGTKATGFSCKVCGKWRPQSPHNSTKICPECVLKERLETGMLFSPVDGWMTAEKASISRRENFWPFPKEE